MATRLIPCVLAALCAVTLIAGCGSGAISGPGGAQSSGAGATGGGHAQGGKRGAGRYGFDLPSGPTNGDQPDGDVYTALQKGDCQGAQRALDTESVSFRRILEVGIALCQGDRTKALRLLRGYRPDFILSNKNTWFLCHLYRAARSSLYGRPRSAFGACPAPPPKTPVPSSTSLVPTTPFPAESPSVTESPVSPEPPVSPSVQPPSPGSSG